MIFKQWRIELANGDSKVTQDEELVALHRARGHAIFELPYTQEMNVDAPTLSESR